MTPVSLDDALWQRVKNYPVGGDKHELFFNQLADHHQWPDAYCQHVILEYQKFIYLNIISELNLAPSPLVDLVWKQHLTFSRSYWKDLCGLIANKPIHRNPFQLNQGKWVKAAYKNTLALYQQHFDNPIDKNIWPHKLNTWPRWLRFLG